MGTLRFILAISVIMAHSVGLTKVNILGGPLAVKAFFIISGFYMALILNEKYTTPDSYGVFIKNRALRLFPIYFAVLVISFFAFYLASQLKQTNPDFYLFFGNPMDSYIQHGSELHVSSWIFFIISNLTIFLQDVAMFFGVDAEGILYFTTRYKTEPLPAFSFLLVPQAWSISIELMFYLIAPFILRRSMALLISIIVLCFAFRIILYQSGLSHDPWNYRFFPLEISYFLLGSISYRIYRYIPSATWITPVRLKILASVPLLYSIGYPVLRFQGSEYVYACVFFLSIPFLFYLTKNWKWDTYIGELSYPMYLTHIVLLFGLKYISPDVSPVWAAIGYFASVIGLSMLLNEVISKGVERIRKRSFERFKALNQPSV
ncbi:MAG: acyltransferase [Cytophagaceae bacterium]|jgi:peptidoglycan/LPS O-acetylase OafA/YrhL|nr:acyltransferase [Cytophagaceae bacterium]